MSTSTTQSPPEIYGALTPTSSLFPSAHTMLVYSSTLVRIVPSRARLIPSSHIAQPVPKENSWTSHPHSTRSLSSSIFLILPSADVTYVDVTSDSVLRTRSPTLLLSHLSSLRLLHRRSPRITYAPPGFQVRFPFPQSSFLSAMFSPA